MVEKVTIPSIIIEELRRRGLDPEDVILDALIRVMDLDPDTVIEARVELAIKYLNEGRELIDKDPVQASEKLYKAAEECVKVLAQYYDLKDILTKVNGRGRWTVTELEKAVEKNKRKTRRMVHNGLGRRKLPPRVGIPRRKTRPRSRKD